MNRILDELKLQDKDENSLLNNLTKIPKKEPRYKHTDGIAEEVLIKSK